LSLDADVPAASSTSAAVEKPDLTVAVVPATAVAGLYIAPQRGYFTAAGLHVRIVPIASGASALPDLVNGSIDVEEGQWTSDLSAEAAGAARLRVQASGNSGGQALIEDLPAVGFRRGTILTFDPVAARARAVVAALCSVPGHNAALAAITRRPNNSLTACGS
jgi:NitT/TauT family transport system substrate-binding protein